MKVVLSTSFMKLNFTLIIILYSLYLINCSSVSLEEQFSEARNCTLLEIQYTQPKPSLSKCYRYNTGACCNSVHDDYIKTELSGLLTSSCLIKYPSLIDLFCLGCSPFQPFFSNQDTKTIKICKSFVESLWIPADLDTSTNSSIIDLNTPTTVFDNCGFKTTDYLSEYTNKSYIIPSSMFKNASDFLLKMDIPFFPGYNFEIFDDYSLTAEELDYVDRFCFKGASYIKMNLLIMLSFLCFFLFN